MSGEELGTQGGDAISSPGEVLAAAREAVGVTHLEVAEALNLPIRTVEAIENNDEARLPAQVFTRGYIRAYAKLLEIDPDPLLATMPGEPDPVQTQESPGPTESASPFKLGIDPHAIISKVGISPQQLAYAGVSIAVLFILVVFVFPFNGADEAIDAPVPASEAVSTATNEASGGGVAPSNSEPAVQVRSIAEHSEALKIAGQKIDIEDAPSVDDAETALPVVAEQADDSPQPVQPQVPSSVAQVDAEPASLEEVAARRLTETGNDSLTLSFSDDCWVEISEPDGIGLFADLGRAGQTLSFVGAGPFRIKLGYAPGVVLAYNAEVVALAVHTRRDVANLVVGR